MISELDSDHKIKFSIEKGIDGKKKKRIIVKCKSCANFSLPLYSDKACEECLLAILYKLKNNKFENLTIEKVESEIKYKELVPLLDYMNKIETFENYFIKIKKIRTSKCNFKEFDCKVIHDFNKRFSLELSEYYNPIIIYKSVKSILKDLENKKSSDPLCVECINIIKKRALKLSSLLGELPIFGLILDFLRTGPKPASFSHFFKYYILKKNFFFDNKRITLKKVDYSQRLIETYNIDKYKMFKVSIFAKKEEREKNYKADLNFESQVEKKIFDQVIIDSLNQFEVLKVNQIVQLEKLIELYRKKAYYILHSRYNFPKHKKKKLAFLITIKKLNLMKIFPLLIDDQIEEIFLDSPDDKIYLNHQTHGRCLTSINLNAKDIERIKTLLRLYSEKRLDYSKPTLKYVIKNKYFFCRFAIDVEPIAINKFSLDIRKLNKNILTIQDLMKKGTLNPLMAAFLYFLTIRKTNITATGETDTGKTTLINALDLILPKEFRKIYIENVVESLEQKIYNKHQLKYQANSIENETGGEYTKSNYIKTLLHRSPDIIFLGEILTKEEAQAMFHCLSAGLKGFQTIHSNDTQSLINRFLFHFNVSLSCLEDLGILILLKKDFNKRRIISISQININKKPYFEDIFRYEPQKNRWLNLVPLYTTTQINKIKKYENLNEEKFYEIISIYQEIFKSLLKNRKISNQKITKLFHRISFYSFNESLKTLKNLCLDFKNGGLN